VPQLAGDVADASRWAVWRSCSLLSASFQNVLLLCTVSGWSKCCSIVSFQYWSYCSRPAAPAVAGIGGCICWCRPAALSLQQPAVPAIHCCWTAAVSCCTPSAPHQQSQQRCSSSRACGCNWWHCCTGCCRGEAGVHLTEPYLLRSTRRFSNVYLREKNSTCQPFTAHCLQKAHVLLWMHFATATGG
jgi:hypothetical protein